MYGKKIIVLDFNLGIGTVWHIFALRYHYHYFLLFCAKSDVTFDLHRSWVLQVLTSRMSQF